MYRRAAAYLRARGVDPRRADDAVNTVMARILSREPSTPDPDNWEAYLMTAVLNAARDEVSTAANRHERSDTVDPVNGGSQPAAGEPTGPVRSHGRQPDPTGDLVAHVVDQARQLAQVRSLIDELPLQQQTVLRQVLLAGRTGQQVAADLGVTEGRVSQLKKAALASLKHKLLGGTP